MIQSAETKNLDAALFAMQCAVGNIPVDAKNTHFNSKYMTLEKMLDVCRPLWQEHKLLVTHSSTEDLKMWTTKVLHIDSMEWRIYFFPLLLSKQDMQAVGSSATYARRYSIKGIHAIGEDDDDGNATAAKPSGSQRPQNQTQARPPAQNQRPAAPAKPATASPLSPAERMATEDGSEELGNYVIQIGKKYKGQKLSTISLDDINSFVKWLENSAKESGKPLSKDAADFCNVAKCYLDQQDFIPF